MPRRIGHGPGDISAPRGCGGARRQGSKVAMFGNPSVLTTSKPPGAVAKNLGHWTVRARTRPRHPIRSGPAMMPPWGGKALPGSSTRAGWRQRISSWRRSPEPGRDLTVPTPSASGSSRPAPVSRGPRSLPCDQGHLLDVVRDCSGLVPAERGRPFGRITHPGRILDRKHPGRP